MKDFQKERYPYQFEVVSETDLEDKEGKYANTVDYPWAVRWIEGSTRSIYALGNKSGGFNMAGYFQERKTGERYPSTSIANNYAAIAYQPFFNAITNHFKK